MNWPVEELTNQHLGELPHTPGEVLPLPEMLLSGPLLSDLLSAVLARGLPFRFRAGGSSMFPFIRDGDVLTIMPLPPCGLRLGDIAAFRRSGSRFLIIHRIVRKTPRGCILKGDHYPPGQTDGLIPAEEMLGIVTRVERQGREDGRIRRIHLGLGPERGLVALLSRLNLLYPCVHLLVILNTALKKRSSAHPRILE